jgi:hypothetical protein
MSLSPETLLHRNLSHRIARAICWVPSMAPPTVNGALVAFGLAFLIAKRFAAMRREGLTPLLDSIALWAMVFALMAITSAAFLLMKRIAPLMLARWRWLAAIAAITLWSIAMAGLGAFSVGGRPAAAGMLYETLLGLKIAVSFAAGLILMGAVFWKQISDVTHNLLIAIASGVAALAVCAVAAILATKLPLWLLATLGAAAIIAICLGAWRNRDAAQALALVLALTMSMILIADLQGHGVLFLLLFAPVLGAWLTTYLRYGEKESDPRWAVAILQYLSWIAVAAGEAYRYLV